MPIMTDRAEVLVVDDRRDFAELVAEQVEDAGHEARIATSGAEALAAFDDRPPAAVLTDLQMPGLDGMAVLAGVLDRDPRVPVIVMTAHGGVKEGVRAVQEGAFHYLSKPFEPGELEGLLARALETRRLRDENSRLRSLARGRDGLDRLVGGSGAMQRLYEQLERVAGAGVPVLIRGESGTGKELVARAIHGLSPRRRRPFVAINCTTLPQALLESELFGHVRGAFTGAGTPRKGLFVEAEGGTLLLDEIGDMPADLQARLLRVLQEGTIRPVGADKERPVDVRVLAATHQPLEEKVDSGVFRADLFYRLNVVPLYVPPLRDRLEDIPALVDRFVAQAREENPGSSVQRFSPRLVAALARRPWPGNVRELLNAVRRIAVLCPEEVADAGDLELLGPPPTAPQAAATAVLAPAASPPPVPSAAPPEPAVEPESPVATSDGKLLTLKEVERRQILAGLEAAGGNKTVAAKLLGTDRKTLYRKMLRFGLVDPDEASEVL